MDPSSCINESSKCTPPLPQRVWRLNRRGFLMSGREKKDFKTLEKSNVKSDATDDPKCSTSRTSIEGKSSSLENKVIKLSNYKKNSLSATENSQKRTLNGEKNLTNNSTSPKKSVDETPPKKKHKPITWP